MTMIVKLLERNDVIFGRGTGPNEHKGNVAFRLDVLQVLKESSKRWKVDKSCTKAKMASKVIERVHGRGGQFVRRLTKLEVIAYLASRDVGDDGKPDLRTASTDASSSPVTTISTGSTSSSSSKSRRGHQHLYAVVSDSIALEKTKQSFRHQKRVLAHQGGHSTKVESPSITGNTNLAARNGDVNVVREELGMQSDSSDVKIDTSPKPATSFPLAYSQLKFPHSVHAKQRTTREGNSKVTPPTNKSVVVPARIQPFGSPLAVPSPIFHPQQGHVANTNVQCTPTTRLVKNHNVPEDLAASTATSSIELVSALTNALQMEQNKHHEASMALLLARRSVLSQMIASRPPLSSSSLSAAAVAAAVPASFLRTTLGSATAPTAVPFLSSTNLVEQAAQASTLQDLLLLSQNASSRPTAATTISTQDSLEKQRLLQVVSSALRQVHADTPDSTGIHNSIGIMNNIATPNIALPSSSTTERIHRHHHHHTDLELLAALSTARQRRHHHLI